MTSEKNPVYQTVTITLTRGLKLGEETIKTAIIREATVGDLLEAESFDNEELKIFKIIARRLLKLGDIDNPGEELLKMLSPVDFTLIVSSAEEMDNNLMGGNKETIKKPYSAKEAVS